MASLIITIISIILVAITVLVGVYYGGQVYNDYMINSKANTLINELSQLSTAGNLYMADNGQTLYEQGNQGVDLSSSFDTNLTNYFTQLNTILGYPIIRTINQGWNPGYKNKNQWACPSPTIQYHRGLCTSYNTASNYVIFTAGKMTACSTMNYIPTVTFDASDEIIKMCQKINKNVVIPNTLTIDPTTQLPIEPTNLFTGSMVGSYANFCQGAGFANIPFANGCFISYDLKQIGIFYSK